MKVQVSLVQEQITQGGTFNANVTVSRGIGEGLDDLITSLMRKDTKKTEFGNREILGLVASARKEYTDRIETVDASIARLSARFEAQRTALLTQFQGLESRVSDLQSVGNLLNAQLASLSSVR